jgi:DNA-binding XRE family transcriptional regulator
MLWEQKGQPFGVEGNHLSLVIPRVAPEWQDRRIIPEKMRRKETPMRKILKELEESIYDGYLVEKEFEKECAQQITEIRKAAGVSIEDFASVVGSSPETIQLIEEGNFRGSLLELHRMFNKATEVYDIND